MSLKHTFRPVHHGQTAASHINCQRILERFCPTAQGARYIPAVLHFFESFGHTQNGKVPAYRNGLHSPEAPQRMGTPAITFW